MPCRLRVPTFGGVLSTAILGLVVIFLRKNKMNMTHIEHLNSKHWSVYCGEIPSVVSIFSHYAQEH